MFLKLHPDHAPLAVLNNSAKSAGCPDGLIDVVVNGAIAQEINLRITPKDITIEVLENALAVPVKEYNPSYDELINDMVAHIDGLEFKRAKAIVDALISKQAITIYDDSKLYRTKVLIPRQLFTI